MISNQYICKLPTGQVQPNPTPILSQTDPEIFVPKNVGVGFGYLPPLLIYKQSPPDLEAKRRLSTKLGKKHTRYQK